MRTILSLFSLLLCLPAFAQQSYVLYLPSPTGNPYYDTNIANVLISNVTFHGKVTFITSSNNPSLWNTNGAGRYSPSDTFAQSLQFGSNVVLGANYSIVLGTANSNGPGSTASVISGGTNNWILTNAVATVIAGGRENQMGGSTVGSTIGGGYSHLMDGGVDAGTIAGGYDGRVRAQYGFIGGGGGNDAGEIGAFVGGGVNNAVRPGSDYGVVVGGQANDAAGDHTFVGGGDANDMNANASGTDGAASVLVGGSRNRIGTGPSSGASYSFIGGGRTNIIPDASGYGVIVGGSFNQVGGGGNAVSGNFIGGGFNNLTDDQVDFAVIVGGVKNVVGADRSAILAGVSNNATATYAFAIGSFLTNATAKTVEIGFGNLSKLRVGQQSLGVKLSLNDTNGIGSMVDLYASTNSGTAVLYTAGSPASQTVSASEWSTVRQVLTGLTTNFVIPAVATLNITNGLIMAISGP